MDYLLAIVLGVVQGVTEFLPISSSGHLLVLHEAFDFATDDSLAFDISLHIGTLITIGLYFTKDIIHYVRTQPQLMIRALLSSIPAGLIGLLFGDQLDHWFRSSWVVVVMAVLVGIVFLLVERYAVPKVGAGQFNWQQAVAMGLAQTVALIPGTSRSGITMAAGMSFGLNRVDAAKFSFIMVIPLLLGLTAKQGVDLVAQPPSPHELGLMLVGAVTAAVVGLFVIRFLLGFFKTSSLRPFAYYRFGLAAVVSLMLLL